MLYDLKIYQKIYDFILWLRFVVQRFSKVYKYSLGIKLENEALELIKQVIRANMKQGSKKEELEECFVHYETVKIFIRLCKDDKLLNIKQYEFASRELVEIGALLGGWYKPYR
jgi:hypothetical protein